MHRIRTHLTYGNVMATIAVFVALGGGAYALDGRNSVDSGDIRRNAVKSSDIARNAAKGGDVKEATLGRVPSANTANTATDISPPEAAHLIGEAGEPPFGAGWGNFDPSTRAPAAFYIDRQGVVHLQGQVSRSSGTNTTIFDLPDSYAPALQESFPAVGNGGTFANVRVDPVGLVRFGSGDPLIVHLNGISWRAGQ